MTAVEAVLESKNWDLCRQTDNQISTLSAPSSTCVLQMTRQGKGSSPDWVGGGLGKAGWSPVSENANQGAAQPAQVLHSQPSYPYHENQTSETWGTPRSHPDGMGLGRNTIQEELSLAALGPELPPQPLAEPATWCQFP